MQMLSHLLRDDSGATAIGQPSLRRIEAVKGSFKALRL